MRLKTLIFSSLISAGALAAFAAPAAADVACNREGDCWHVDSRYDRPGITFEYHPDDWYFHRHWRNDRDERWRWRAYREDRGYWRNGVWITFYKIQQMLMDGGTRHGVPPFVCPGGGSPANGESEMKIRTLVLGAVAGAAAIIATAAPASAYVVCNRYGSCWHTSDRYDYKPTFGVRIHDDNWKWRARDHYRWREHEGRGYWNRSGVWITF